MKSTNVINRAYLVCKMHSWNRKAIEIVLLAKSIAAAAPLMWFAVTLEAPHVATMLTTNVSSMLVVLLFVFIVLLSIFHFFEHMASLVCLVNIFEQM